MYNFQICYNKIRIGSEAIWIRNKSFGFTSKQVSKQHWKNESRNQILNTRLSERLNLCLDIWWIGSVKLPAAELPLTDLLELPGEGHGDDAPVAVGHNEDVAGGCWLYQAGPHAASVILYTRKQLSDVGSVADPENLSGSSLPGMRSPASWSVCLLLGYY